MGPLAGLKVIDLTHVMAGPTCTLMLADMGADVIKIEKIPEGDDTRHTPPRIGNEAASFLMMNRNKRGLALDLKRPGGAAVLHRLLASADVLVENYAPGVIERLGFGYEDLRKTYPALIYCSLSGFGRTGPYKDRRGFDLVASMAMGSAHPLNAPYQALEAADGWIVVGGANQRNWLRILEALQASHLAHDQRFLASADRMAHLKELEAELSPRFRAKSSAYWLEILDQKGVPCGPRAQHIEGALRSANNRARHGGGRASFVAGRSKDAGFTGEIFRDARPGTRRRAAVWRARPSDTLRAGIFDRRYRRLGKRRRGGAVG